MATASTAIRKLNKIEEEMDRDKEYATIKKVSIGLGISDNCFNWRDLKKKSEQLNRIVRKVWDANYGQLNSYHKEVWMSLYSVDLNKINEQRKCKVIED